MSVDIRIVRAAARTTAGTQDFTVSENLGEPKAAIFVVSSATTDDVSAADARLAFGLTDGTSQYCASLYMKDNVLCSAALPMSASVCKRRFSNSQCITFVQTHSPSVIPNATFLNWITDATPGQEKSGVRVYWNIPPSAAYIVTVILFCGTDVTAKVGNFQANATVGQSTTVTLGWQLDQLFTVGQCTSSFDSTFSSGDAELGIGVCDYSGTAISQYSSNSTTRENYSSSQSFNLIATDRVYRCSSSTRALQISSVTSTTFVATTLASSHTFQFAYLALKYGGKAGHCVQLVTSPSLLELPSNVVTTVPGFKPQFVFQLPSNCAGLLQQRQTSWNINPSLSTGAGAGYWGISGFTGRTGNNNTPIFTSSISDDDAANPTNTESFTSVSFRPRTDTPPPATVNDLCVASFVSFDTGSYTLNYTVNNAYIPPNGTTIRYWPTLVIGEYSGAVTHECSGTVNMMIGASGILNAAFGLVATMSMSTVPGGSTNVSFVESGTSAMQTGIGGATQLVISRNAACSMQTGIGGYAVLNMECSATFALLSTCTGETGQTIPISATSAMVCTVAGSTNVTFPKTGTIAVQVGIGGATQVTFGETGSSGLVMTVTAVATYTLGYTTSIASLFTVTGTENETSEISGSSSLFLTSTATSAVTFGESATIVLTTQTSATVKFTIGQTGTAPLNMSVSGSMVGTPITLSATIEMLTSVGATVNSTDVLSALIEILIANTASSSISFIQNAQSAIVLGCAGTRVATLGCQGTSNLLVGSSGATNILFDVSGTSQMQVGTAGGTVMTRETAALVELAMGGTGSTSVIFDGQSAVTMTLDGSGILDKVGSWFATANMVISADAAYVATLEETTICNLALDLSGMTGVSYPNSGTVALNLTTTPLLGVVMPASATIVWVCSVMCASPVGWNFYGSPRIYVASENVGLNYGIEVYMRATAGKIYARLYDETLGIPLPGSMVATNPDFPGLWERIRSGRLELVDGSVYRAQVSREIGATGEIMSCCPVVL